METTKRTATEKRLDAIGAITHKYIDSTTGLLTIEDTTENRVMVGTEIIKLWDLGRTDRWRVAVRDWCDLVVEESNGFDFRWTILQGAIYTGFKA